MNKTILHRLVRIGSVVSMIAVSAGTVSVATSLPVRASRKTKSTCKITIQKKRLTRTIKFKLPKGKKTEVVKQTATLKRRVKINPKTKQKIYGKWSVGTWKAVRAKKIAGYRPSIAKIPAALVTSQTSKVTLVVTYQKKPRPGAEIRKHQKRIEKWRKHRDQLNE